MEINTTKQKQANKKHQKGQKLKRNLKDVECYNCHKKGHFKRNCQSKEKPQTERVAAITITNDHAKLLWTACINNYCPMHLGNKEGSGYFPSKRRVSICAIRIRQ